MDLGLSTVMAVQQKLLKLNVYTPVGDFLPPNNFNEDCEPAEKDNYKMRYNDNGVC